MSNVASHPVLSCAEAKAWESTLLRDEAAEWAAMQRAGAAIAKGILADFRELGGLPENARLLVLVGKGHNGGDALLATKSLLAARRKAKAEILLVFGETGLRPLTSQSLEELRISADGRVREVDLATLKRELAHVDVCLDGVFGFQFRPPLDDSTAEAIAWVNTHPRISFRASVDLPSGMGEANGKTVFRADFTYATGVVKSPVVAATNAALVGRVRYLDLGFFAGEDNQRKTQQTVLLAAVLRPLAQLRPTQSDKRTYGHLLVVGGSRNYPGAVLMTVKAALRSGVGLLTAFVPASLVPEYAAKFPEAMWIGWPETAHGGLSVAGALSLLEHLPRATALLIGPGLGAAPETLAAVQAIVRGTTFPLLLDADALQPEIMAAVGDRPLIVTPHAGEFARIASVLAPAAVLVRKGAPTSVETGGRAAYSFFGGPVLARGGSGDLLAGLVGGLMAQAPDDLWLAAARGVVWHGLAADLLARDKGQVAVQTTQLLEFLQPALHGAEHDTT
ncbi:MAG: NAD(P)H-hydrate dehydratase [Candidatus Didemnitutus sp.]|nr:NAD(P)H-hydrate dehydratase [Candidatus Didemnitutus sp.]